MQGNVDGNFDCVFEAVQDLHLYNTTNDLTKGMNDVPTSIRRSRSKTSILRKCPSNSSDSCSNERRVRWDPATCDKQKCSYFEAQTIQSISFILAIATSLPCLHYLLFVWGWIPFPSKKPWGGPAPKRNARTSVERWLSEKFVSWSPRNTNSGDLMTMRII